MIYALHGITIESEEPLHERIVLADRAALRLEIDPPRPIPDEEPPGKNLMRYVGPNRSSMTFTRVGPDHDVLRFHGLAQFDVHVTAGLIRATIDLRRDPEMLPILFSGNVLNHIFVTLGDPVLHASAVSHHDRTIAFLARPGGGKSTLSAVACAAGAKLVGDDLLRLQSDDSSTSFSGSAAIRLRAGVRDHVLSLFRTMPEYRETADGRTAVAPPSISGDHARLDAIVVPVLDPGAVEVEVEPVDPPLAAHTLLALPRMGSWTDPQIITSVFDSAATVAAAVPMYRATVPWGELPRIELIESLLERLP